MARKRIEMTKQQYEAAGASAVTSGHFSFKLSLDEAAILDPTELAKGKGGGSFLNKGFAAKGGSTKSRLRWAWRWVGLTMHEWVRPIMRVHETALPFLAGPMVFALVCSGVAIATKELAEFAGDCTDAELADEASSACRLPGAWMPALPLPFELGASTQLL